MWWVHSGAGDSHHAACSDVWRWIHFRADGPVLTQLPCRKQILEQYAQQLSTEQLEQLANGTHSLSARDLKDVCAAAERKVASQVSSLSSLRHHISFYACCAIQRHACRHLCRSTYDVIMYRTTKRSKIHNQSVAPEMMSASAAHSCAQPGVNLNEPNPNAICSCSLCSPKSSQLS